MTATTCNSLHASDNLGLAIPSGTVARTTSHGLSQMMRLLLEFEAMLDRARERKAMRDLDGRILKDIGLSDADVERETSKPFWRR